MNENLNLVEILKDCPKGTKLYSTVFGEIKFGFIEENSIYPIVLILNGEHEYLTLDGKLYETFGGECILFPSKEQRDWSKFKINQYGLAPIREFKDGDILATNSGSQVFILQRQKGDKEGSCYIGYDFELNDIFFGGEFKFARFVTEEEKQKLFDAIKERGHKWNAETKTLETLPQPKFKVGDRIRYKEANKDDVYEISKVYADSYGIVGYTFGIYMKYQDQYELVPNKPKFDPKTLMAFDKVLVRLTKDCIWNATFFSHYDKEVNWGCYSCVTTSCKSYSKCIPYNDETKHLLGTSDEAPEYYRYWED